MLQIVALMELEGVPVRAPVSKERLAQFERQWSVELNDDMRAFYLLMDGTSKSDFLTRMLVDPSSLM